MRERPATNQSEASGGAPLHVVLCGGGTGGDVYPALAVAAVLSRKRPGIRLLYLGGNRVEARLAPAAGIRFRRISVHGISGRGFSGLFTRLRGLAELVLCIPLIQSMLALNQFRADVVLGAGGYVSGPVLLAAHLLGIPTIALEGNRTPGLTSRMVCRFVDIVAVGWSDQARQYRQMVKRGARIVATGLPIRREVVTLSREQGAAAFGFDPELATLVLIGGSLGSLKLNEALVGALRELGRFDSRLKLVQVLHVTGRRPQYAAILPDSEADEICPHYQHLPYLDEKYPHALAAADLAITRGGAGTVAEIAARGLPSILVPWGAATNGEQARNVEPLREAGGAVVIPDDEFNASALASALRVMLWDRDRLQEMAQAARLLGKPRAAEEVAELVLELAETKALRRSVRKRGAAGRRKGPGRGATRD